MPQYIAVPVPMSKTRKEITGTYASVREMISKGLRDAQPGEYRITAVVGKRRRPVTKATVR